MWDTVLNTNLLMGFAPEFFTVLDILEDGRTQQARRMEPWVGRVCEFIWCVRILCGKYCYPSFLVATTLYTCMHTYTFRNIHIHKNTLLHILSLFAGSPDLTPMGEVFKSYALTDGRVALTEMQQKGFEFESRSRLNFREKHKKSVKYYPE